MEGTAGCMPAQAPKVPAERVRKKHRVPSLEEDGVGGVNRCLEVTPKKTLENCKVLLVFKVNKLMRH